jgi:hypothetical protein
MLNYTLSNSHNFEDYLLDEELNVKRQIYISAVFPYRVESRLVFKIPNQLPYGRYYNVQCNANYIIKLPYQLQCRLQYKIQ